MFQCIKRQSKYCHHIIFSYLFFGKSHPGCNKFSLLKGQQKMETYKDLWLKNLEKIKLGAKSKYVYISYCFLFHINFHSCIVLSTTNQSTLSRATLYQLKEFKRKNNTNYSIFYTRFCMCIFMSVMLRITTRM